MAAVNRTKWNLFLDIALVVTFIAEMEEGFTVRRAKNRPLRRDHFRPAVTRIL